MKKSVDGLVISIVSDALPALNSFLEKLLEISKEVKSVNWSQWAPNSTVLGTNDIQNANENVTNLRKSVEALQARIAAGEGGLFIQSSLAAQIKLLEDAERLVSSIAKQTPIELGEEFDYRVPSLLPQAPKGGGGGKGAKSEWDSWVESLKKAGEAADLLPRKIDYIAVTMAKLKEEGKEGSNAFKELAETYKKLNEESAKGNVGAEIELQVQKIKEEATLTAEKMAYLGEAIAAALAVGDVEGYEALLDIMDKLKGKTDETADQFKKLGEGITDAIASNANNAVNSFIDNIGQAELSFADFATSVIKDIAKVIVQLLIMKPIIDSIKGFFGGGFGGGVKDYAFADGAAFSGGTSLAQGVYTQPTLFKFAKGGTFGHTGLMGEAGPEAIMPLKRTASGELGVQGSPVNVNIYNNAGVEIQTESSTGSDGTKQIDVYIERKIKDGIASGSYDRVMRGSYGLTRVGA
jgi:hypothetical protein